MATGKYLELQIDSLRYLEKRGLRQQGVVTIIEVSRDGGWSADELNLVSCEDNSTWRMLDKRGDDVTPKDQPDYIQELKIIRAQNKWKVSAVKVLKLGMYNRRIAAHDLGTKMWLAMLLAVALLSGLNCDRPFRHC